MDGANAHATYIAAVTTAPPMTTGRMPRVDERPDTIGPRHRNGKR